MGYSTLRPTQWKESSACRFNERVIDDVVIGISNSADKRSARCRRLTPQTTARAQASRRRLWLIGGEGETPWRSGGKDPRWFGSSRSEPCATIHRSCSGWWNVERACLSTWEGAGRHQIGAVVPNAPGQARWRRSTCIIVVPFSLDEPPQASWESAVTPDAHCRCPVTALGSPAPPSMCQGRGRREESSREGSGKSGLPYLPGLRSPSGALGSTCKRPAEAAGALQHRVGGSRLTAGAHRPMKMPYVKGGTHPAVGRWPASQG
jgi:hypothetical protein